MTAPLQPKFRKAYILGGNARFTVRSPRTGLRVTYRVKLAPDAPEDRPLWFVSVLTGPDNTSDYEYLGTLSTDQRGRLYFRHGRKSRLPADAPSAKAFDWLSQNLLDPRIEVWHLGTCSRCGRDLTDPESIQRGLGPICVERGMMG